MGLFKTGQELIKIGQSCLKQGDFSKALSNFQKASHKLKNQGDLQNAQLSDTLVSVLMIGSNPDVGISITALNLKSKSLPLHFSLVEEKYTHGGQHIISK